MDRVSLVLDPCVVVQTTQLEEGQSSILVEYDHVFDLVQLGRDISQHILDSFLFFYLTLFSDSFIFAFDHTLHFW